ncbi:MAG: SDR family NAD(P)-dependent oxidoreductase [Chitinophagaceae bacterium]
MASVIITGISGNLGSAVAKQFLNEGAKVTGTYTGNKPDGFDGTSCKLYSVDLTNEDAAQKFVQQYLADEQQVDVAVLTVGGFTMGNIDSTTASDLTKQISLNFYTAYNIARPVFTAMKARGRGRIFLIGSLAGAHPAQSKSTIAYGMSKSMLFSLASMLNAEAGDTNVVTSIVVPSTIDTKQNRAAMPDADPSTWVKAEQIAQVISWYSGEAAEKIRQPVIYLTGKRI